LSLIDMDRSRGPTTLFGRIGFIFVCTLALRLVSGMVMLHREPQILDAPTFGYEAVHIAQSLASGRGFSSPFPDTGPTAWLAPIYPTILAADVRIFGAHSRASLVAAVLLNELCSVLTVLPIFYAGKRIAGATGVASLGAIAAWFWAISPLSMITAGSMIWYTTLSALLGAVILLATLAIVKSQSAAAWVGYGIIWGVELMTNPSFLVLLPPAILWLMWVRAGARKRITFPAIAGLAALVCCVPWTVRNYEVFHHLVPLRSNFGLELWRYNHGGFPLQPFDSDTERSHLSAVGEPSYMAEKQHSAIEWIDANRGGFLRLCMARALEFWIGDDHPFNILLARRGWIQRSDVLANFVLVPLLLAGLIFTWRDMRRYFWLLVSAPLLFPLVYYITLAATAYRAPIDPILDVIAGAAVLIVWNSVQMRKAPTLHSAK
jgi:hypothetical protein